MLNVYVGVSVCGSSGRLRVLSSHYLWATAVTHVRTPSILSCKKMFQSWVGLVLFFLGFTRFNIAKGKLNVPASVCMSVFVVLWFGDVYLLSLHPDRTWTCMCTCVLSKTETTELVSPTELLGPLSTVCPFVVEVVGRSSARSSWRLLLKQQFDILGNTVMHFTAETTASRQLA